MLLAIEWQIDENTRTKSHFHISWGWYAWYVLQIVAACCVAAAWAQQQPRTTPVPILKQINRQNEDGSYSYGYEGADGSYKIETKQPTGEVHGKYGYVDDTGNLREIEYGASKLGFQPAGTGINVAPPTVPDQDNYVGPDGYDDGQYREDPSVYWKDPKYNKGAPKYAAPVRTQITQPAAQPQYQPAQTWQQPAQRTWQQPAQPTWQQPQPAWQPQPSWQRSWDAPAAPAVPVNQDIFRGHPATNFDVYTGSYSVNYK